MSAPSVSLREAYRFFVPLVFMTELNAISKSIIHAFLARTAAPSVTLAAFNTSFIFYYTATSATEVTALLTISYLDRRRALRRLVAFLALLVAPALLAVLAVAFTPLGDWLYGTVFGASPAAVAEARAATAVFALSAPALLARGTAFGLLMLHRHTTWITLATLVRVLSLGASLVVLPWFLDGAVIGAAALVACMACEAAFAWAGAWRHFAALPAGEGRDPPSYRALWRFAWPLVLNNLSELGVVLVINVFLGRLARPDVALAAFGVVHGLVSLLFSPLRNLVQTAQTLAEGPADRPVLALFALQLAAGFAVLAVAVFDTPLAAVVLERVMGLGPELAGYCEPAVRVAFAMALFWALAALFRGLLAGVRSTAMLAVTGGLRLAAAAGIGLAGLALDGVNGAVLGLAAWIVAYAVESAVLGWRLGRPDVRGAARVGA